MLVGCVGDSLTQFGIRQNGWVSLLNTHYERRAQFLCEGYSGYNTQWLLAHLPAILSSMPPPSLSILWLGTNDCCTDTSQHVAVEAYKDNLSRIIKELGAHCSGPVFVLPPVPTARPERAMHPDYSRACGSAANTLAQQGIDARFVDLHACAWQAEDFSDGLHLSNSGNQKIAALITSHIDPLIPQVPRLPDWKTL